MRRMRDFGTALFSGPTSTGAQQEGNGTEAAEEHVPGQSSGTEPVRLEVGVPDAHRLEAQAHFARRRMIFRRDQQREQDGVDEAVGASAARPDITTAAQNGATHAHTARGVFDRPEVRTAIERARPGLSLSPRFWDHVRDWERMGDAFSTNGRPSFWDSIERFVQNRRPDAMEEIWNLRRDIYGMSAGPYQPLQQAAAAPSTQTPTIAGRTHVVHLNPPAKADCTACLDSFPPRDMVRLDCGHAHCPACLEANARSSLNTQPFTPAKCCRVIPTDSFRHLPALTEDEVKTYIAKVEELTSTQQKLYCFDCAAFIPSSSRKKRSGECERCGKKTCKACLGKSHFGPCDREKLTETRKGEENVYRLAESKGWKKCPNCLNIVQKGGGCNHMQ
ncbi:hypothetical protein DL762_002624 [Monosporascus cannonballus]|uniref:RING-type domain-containing protein n=1 Tax=Monosporascus cannonballus TaxID=155416 RepID=A0ABY0HDF4_9PEZI|nr:hypothetical protein DL762_002624 [Monosporascus cannonballus]RYO98647.1 hypothetical protein DL763_002076 [Monosporascus cannonballus]